MVEYILCYGGPAEHWGPLLATRLASRKILIQQNIKKRTGPTKEALYPRRETAVCICPISGGGRFVYINCFCTE